MTEKELEKLSATLEKEKARETPNEKKVADLENQIKEKEKFIRSLSSWVKGEDPEEESSGDDGGSDE